MPWADDIKQRTMAVGHPVEIVFYGGGALGGDPAQYELAKNGIADISAIWNPGAHPGVFPLTEIFSLPFLTRGCEAAGLVTQELYDTEPAFKSEYDNAGLKIIGFTPSPDSNILITRTKQVKTIDDLKGVKITSVGTVQSQGVNALGGVPVMMPPPDVYMGLERGVVDGTFSNPEGILTFKFNEITKYRTVLPVGIFSNPLVVAMNPDSFDGLPTEVQKIFNELTGVYLSKLAGEAMDRAIEKYYKDLIEYDKKAGNPEYYLLPDTEFQRWVETTKLVHERTITDLETKGLPAKNIYEEALRLIEKYSK